MAKRSGFKRAVDGNLELYVEGNLVVTFHANGSVEFASAPLIDFGSAIQVNLPQVMNIGSVNYAFPADNGTSGQQLTTDGEGVLSWGASGV